MVLKNASYIGSIIRVVKGRENRDVMEEAS